MVDNNLGNYEIEAPMGLFVEKPFRAPVLAFLMVGVLASGVARGAGKCLLLAPDQTFVETMLIENNGTAEKRVAFLLGNERYAEEVGPLENPEADATAVAGRLQSLGFKVFLTLNATRTETERCFARVLEALAGADLGLFFYAGHGFQADDRNFIVTVDAAIDISSEKDLVGIEPIVSGFQETARASVFILDACRTTPWAEAGRAGLAIGALGRGLVRGAQILEKEAAEATQTGVYLAYATSPNATALDGNGRHSPFTEALLNHLGKPGHSLSRVMASVKNRVGEETDWSQTPWTRSSLPVPIYLNGRQTLPELITASENLADKAREHAARGKFQDALSTALKALPRTLNGSTPGNEFRAAYSALYNSLRQRPIRLPVWEQTTASASGLHVFSSPYTFAQPGRQVTVWDISTGHKVTVLGRGKLDQKNGGIVAWDQNSNGDVVAALTADGQLELWDTTTGRLRRQSPIEPQESNASFKRSILSGFIAFGPSDAYLVSTGGKVLKLWDAKSATLVRTYSLPAAKGGPSRLSEMSEDSGKMTEWLEGSPERMAELIHRMSKSVETALASFMFNPQISPDGRMVAASSNNKIFMWSLESGRLLRELTGSEMWSVQNPTVFVWWGFDQASQYVGMVNSKGAWLWNAQTGDLLFEWPSNGRFIEGSISPDGRIFALRTRTRDWEYRSTETGEVIVEPPVAETIERRLILSLSGEVMDELVNPDFTDWTRGPTGDALIAAALARLDDDQRMLVVRDRLKYWPLASTSRLLKNSVPQP